MIGAICGGLLLQPDDQRTRAEWVRKLALPNPAYIAWLKHGKGPQRSAGRGELREAPDILIQADREIEHDHGDRRDQPEEQRKRSAKLHEFGSRENTRQCKVGWPHVSHQIRHWP